MKMLHKTTASLLAVMALQFSAWLNVSAANTDNPAEIRTRRVPAGTTMAAGNTIPEVGTQVIYSFFPEVAYTVTVSRVEQVTPETILIQSDAQDGRDITCLSVVAADGTRLTVRDHDRQRLYQCVSLSDGGWEYREYDLSKELPRTPLPPIVPPQQAGDETETAPPFGLMNSGDIELAASTPVYIDVMFVFETKAQTWAGNNGGIAAFAADAIARMNIAMQVSGIECTFRLAATVTKNYTHNINNDISVPFFAIAGNEGVFSDLEALRTTHGADLVSLMVDTGSAYGSTGIGYVMLSPSGNARHAYTTCSIRAVNMGHTHTHEIGHNLGCGHAASQTSAPGPGLFPYSSGYYFTASKKKYHTIMAYNYDRNIFYNESDYFSTPLKTYGTSGVAVGNSSTADNARNFRETMAVASAYRTSQIATLPSAPAGISSTDGDSTAEVAVSWTPSSGATTYSVWRSTSSSSSSAVSLSSSVVPTSYADATAAPGVLYYYWVKASNSEGTSDFSVSDTGYQGLSAPTGVSATDGTLTTGVAVSWSAVTGATHYRVYRATTSGGNKSTLGSWQTGTTYSDTSAVAGTTYYYFVAAAVDASGTRPSDYSAYVTGKRAAPANDDFASAVVLSGNSGSASGTNQGATTQAGEPEHNGQASAINSVWWTWTAPASGQATFNTIGSSFDTVLAIYTGTSVGTLTPIASNDDADGYASRVTVNTTAGTIYRIAVAGYGGEFGSIVLNWSFASVTEPTIMSSMTTTISGTSYFQLRFKVDSGQTYHVQRTDSLTSPSWSNVATISATSDGTMTVNIAIPPDKSSGFYRVQLAE